MFVAFVYDTMVLKSADKWISRYSTTQTNYFPNTIQNTKFLSVSNNASQQSIKSLGHIKHPPRTESISQEPDLTSRPRARIPLKRS